MTDVKAAGDVLRVLKGVLKASKGWKAAGVLTISQAFHAIKNYALCQRKV
jgi:hypothetical protein